MAGKNITPPLIVHIIYKLDVGGLENGLVNLINNMPEDKFRHVIICLSSYTEFRQRIKSTDVKVYALHKKDGKDLFVYVKLWWLLVKIKADIVHTRNMGTIDCVIIAMLAGVRTRIHSEHGREGEDTDGNFCKYNRVRRLISPFLACYIALSKNLETWLNEKVGVKQEKLAQIYNGVDDRKFKCNKNVVIPEIQKWKTKTKSKKSSVIIGTVGRMAKIKDQTTMALAFIEVKKRLQKSNVEVFLVMIGQGELKSKIEEILQNANLADHAWLPGDRNDIAALLNSFDIFVLPSKNEGISNTILEAMACGLPVIATRVGGNPELVKDAESGLLVSPESASEMADAIETYVLDIELIAVHGTQGRKRIEQSFGMQCMINSYISVYETALISKK